MDEHCGGLDTGFSNNVSEIGSLVNVGFGQLNVNLTFDGRLRFVYRVQSSIELLYLVVQGWVYQS